MRLAISHIVESGDFAIIVKQPLFEPPNFRFLEIRVAVMSILHEQRPLLRLAKLLESKGFKTKSYAVIVKAGTKGLAVYFRIHIV